MMEGNTSKMIQVRWGTRKGRYLSGHGNQSNSEVPLARSQLLRPLLLSPTLVTVMRLIFFRLSVSLNMGTKHPAGQHVSRGVELIDRELMRRYRTMFVVICCACFDGCMPNGFGGEPAVDRERCRRSWSSWSRCAGQGQLPTRHPDWRCQLSHAQRAEVQRTGKHREGVVSQQQQQQRQQRSALLIPLTAGLFCSSDVSRARSATTWSSSWTTAPP